MNSFKYTYRSGKELDEKLVREISKQKKEPKWMLNKRLKALEIFNGLDMPKWGSDLTGIDFANIHYYLRPFKSQKKSWDDVPEDVRETFERIGVPKAERTVLSGVKAQYDSEVIYGSLKKSLAKKGIVFLSMDEGLEKYPELVKKYFGSVVPLGDNKLAALNSAVWSGGSFVYVPKGVEVGLPLQAYFRINSERAGQFERTLIIADERSNVHYVEGCFTAGASILTKKGLKLIEEVTKDDFVLTHKDRFKKVNYLQKRKFKGKMYKISYYGDSTRELEVTEEHPFLFVRRNRLRERNIKWKKKWGKPGDLIKGDYLVVPIEKRSVVRDTVEFKIKKWQNKKKIFETGKVKVACNLDFFRLIGYYLAEGSMGGGYYLNFSFGAHEAEYLRDVKKLMKKVFGVDVSHENIHKSNNGISLVYSSVELCRIFAHFGRGNSGKFLPDWVIYEDKAKQKELIKGWFRGDGNYYRRRHNSGMKEVFRINTTSEELVRQGQRILARLGIVAFINARDRVKEKRKTMYTLGISGAWMVGFGKIVGIEIDEKVNGKKRASMFGCDGRYIYVPVKKISYKEVMDVEVFNFGVEDDESYVVNGVAVHNCSAPAFSTGSLHSAVVEIVVEKGAKVTYTTVQNWYKNVYNLVTKRALVKEEGQMRWVDGNLGCLVGDSLVSTPSGWKRIEEIKKGDDVYTMDLEEMIPVKALVKGQKMTGIKEVFELSTWDHRKIRATNNHPFLSLKKRRSSKVFEMGWSSLEHLKEEDLIGVLSCLGKEGVSKSLKINLNTNRLVNVPDLPAESDEDVMWFLGAYLGDGCLERARTQKGVTKRISSTYLAETIRQLGFEGTAKTKRVPDWIYLLPLNQKLAFIEGYLDTDGCVREKKVVGGRLYGQLVFASANKELLEQMKLLMITCGLEPKKITTYVKERKLYKGIRKEYISHYMSMNIHNNLRVIREKKYKGRYFRFVRVRGIKKLFKKQKVYDIEVKGHHNFIANGIVVHNSKTTMKYPSCILAGRKAKGEMLSIAWAGKDQVQDVGAKMIHLAPETTSQIISKSISKDGGRSSYRGLVYIAKGAVGAKSKVVCDALILDDKSRSDTYPTNKIFENQASLEHEATVGKIGEEQLFYLMSRGIKAGEAEAMIVNGFLEPVMKQIPLEYAIEMNKLVEMEMEGSVG